MNYRKKWTVNGTGSLPWPKWSIFHVDMLQFKNYQKIIQFCLSWLEISWMEKYTQDDFVLICFLLGLAYYCWNSHWKTYLWTQNCTTPIFYPKWFFKYRPERSSLSFLSSITCEHSYELFSVFVVYLCWKLKKKTTSTFCQVKNLSLL